MMNKHCPRSHRGYYREDDDLSVNDGAIQRNKDWSTYRKTDTFIVICAAIVLASIIGGGIAIGVHFATGGSATGDVGHASAARVVPRFPAMQFNAAHPNGTHYGINSTLSGILSTGTPTLCSDDAEINTVTKFMNQTTADATTTIKMTRTQTLHKSAEGTTVSSAKAVNTILSGSSSAPEFVPVVTEVITTSVTETAYLTATATESRIVSEPESSMASTQASTSDATSQVETSSADVVSVVLTKTLTETRKVTSTVKEVVSTATYTPTTIIRSTVTVTSQPFGTSSREAQCSREVQDHTVYVTVTESADPSPSTSTTVSSKASETSFSSAPASKATDTIVVTYTVTVDSLTPISKVPVVSSSSGVPKHSTGATSHSQATSVVTQVATQTLYVSVANGTAITFSTAVSSVLGHVGTPVLTSLPSTETAQASTAADVVVITKTVTDQVFQTLSAAPTSLVDAETHIETDTQTSVVTVTALPSTSSESPLSTKSILTTIVLSDHATKTVTIGGMVTVTAHPKKSTFSGSAHNSTRTDTKIITEVDVRTLTVTISGHVQTSLVTVHKDLTATVTQTKALNTSASISTDVFRLPSANTTVYISGTPMMHPRPTTATFPPYAITNGTVFRPTTTFFNPSGSASGSRPPTSSTVVVVSNAEKRAEPVAFGLDAATGGCKSCTTCLVIFVLGLLVLF
ncbi:uncharacterized protein ColSpa_12580 [Colletotrichum spaethianum]|uniref:Uncharacterized protein n=1 Tax=Colletotrichum spaethianum TaxID=700344 RepID=A0AA37PHN0_9PEZI|nr:uncharacterized protein ColSpa_12580 [Colletotrichum spaethianum]GKT52399.1 hypothetical protein ColSpa_12580 [Colletotrichum spaethianum]